MHFRTYLITFGVLVGFILVPLAALSAWITPPTGDLTRTGYLSERTFAWRQPQRLVRGAVDWGTAWQGHHDVLVFGDSFSERDTYRIGTWVDRFQAATGLTVLVLRPEQDIIDSALASASFASDPPRLVILEGVERALAARYTEAACEDQPAPAPVTTPDTLATVTGTEPGTPVAYEQIRPWPVNFGYALRYALRVVGLDWPGRSGTETIVQPLARDDAFSSRRPDVLLITSEDLAKRTWTEDTARGIACAIMGIQRRVEANGTSRFVFAPAPDKSSVYRDDIDGELASLPSLADWPAAFADLPMPPVFEKLRAAARQAKDVYLPNDTHWGWRGQQAFADVLIEYLVSHRMLRAAPDGAAERPTAQAQARAPG